MLRILLLVLLTACGALASPETAGARQAETALACGGPQPVAPPVQIHNNPPPIPTLLAPRDGTSAGTATPVFTWSPVIDSEGDSVIFQIQVDEDPGFGSPAIDGHLGPEATFTPARPLPAGTYCWRVRAIDDINARSPYSAAFAVTIPANAAPGR